jgi:hypothetical protein
MGNLGKNEFLFLSGDQTLTTGLVQELKILIILETTA